MKQLRLVTFEKKATSLHEDKCWCTCLASFGQPPQEAPDTIAEKQSFLFFFFLLVFLPARQSMSVVLPAPEAPMRQASWWGLNAPDTSLSSIRSAPSFRGSSGLCKQTTAVSV